MLAINARHHRRIPFLHLPKPWEDFLVATASSLAQLTSVDIREHFRKYFRLSAVQTEAQPWTALGSKILALRSRGPPVEGERMSRDNLSSITCLKYARGPSAQTR